MSKAVSLADDSTSSERLINLCFEAVFSQLGRYLSLMKSLDPIDWKLFVKKRNKQRSSGNQNFEHEDKELEDEKSIEETEYLKHEEIRLEEEKEKQRNEETKVENSRSRDFINEMIEDQTDKEFKKINKFYDADTITKCLRMVDLFTSMAVINAELRQSMSKAFDRKILFSLIKMMLSSRHTHGVIIINILSNLSRSLSDLNIFNDTFDHFNNDIHVSALLEKETKAKFADSSLVMFLFKYLLHIRSHQWNKRIFASSGAYDVS